MSASVQADVDVDVVVPSSGRATLGRLLESLASAGAERFDVLVVLDGAGAAVPRIPAALGGRVGVLRSEGRGPAAARNAGWRASGAEWVTFLDDDVVIPPEWPARLRTDLRALHAGVAASQGRVRVPLEADAPPTDWERNVKGLEGARWATADMAYRRTVLAELGGFDERFPRAYREDADLGLRTVASGRRIVTGSRHVDHPVGPSSLWASVRLQRGNRDDVLMTALHGPRWRQAVGAPEGRHARHLAVTAAGTLAVAGAALGWRDLAVTGLAAWTAGVAELAYRRIAPGPRDVSEIVRMVVTSAVIPAAATWHRLVGRVLLARTVAGPGPPAIPVPGSRARAGSVERSERLRAETRRAAS